MNDIIFAVCMLFQVSGSNVVGSATGFFYENNDNLYLVTNRHVVEFSINDPRSKLVFSLHTDSSDLSKMRQFDVLLNQNGNIMWFGCEDTIIDVVAIPLNPTILTNGIGVIKPLSAKNFPPEGMSLGVGDQLLAVGYPLGFTDEKNKIPIVKSCIISTPIEVPFDGYPMMVIEGNLQKGMSGSPIITKPSSILTMNNSLMFSQTPEFFFIGIHSATFHKAIDYKEEPIYEIKEGKIEITGFKKELIKENLGLQTCWTNGVIQDLIESIEQQVKTNN